MRPPYFPHNPRATAFEALEIQAEVKASMFVGPTFAESMQSAWSAQPRWDIDPLRGDDNARGDAAAPLKTWAELRLRQLNGRQGSCTIYIHGDLPAYDPLVFDWVLGDSIVNVEGLPVVVDAGTLTAPTLPANPAINRPVTITDAAQDFSTELYATRRLLRATTGAAAGCYAAALQVGAGVTQAETTTWLAPAGLAATPAIGDAYEIVTLPVVAEWLMAPRGSGQLFLTLLSLGSATTASAWPLAPDAPVYVEIDQCTIAVLITTQSVVAWGSVCLSPLATGGGFVDWLGGMIGDWLASGNVVGVQGAVNLDLGCYIWGAGVLVRDRGKLTATSCAVFDAPANAIRVTAGGLAALDDCWGNGSVGGGCVLQGIATASATANTTVAGATEVTVGTLAATTWVLAAGAGFRIVDPASASQLSPP